MDATPDSELVPSIDSKKRDERILARRERIEKRSQNAKNQGGLSDKKKQEKLEDKDTEMSRNQIDMSNQRIDKLRYDGTELVTNVGVAAMAREDGRKVQEEDLNKIRRERLEAEVKASMERFEEISKRWDGANSLKIPQELNETMMSQRDLIDSMIAEKDKIIQEFQLELKSKDDQYVKDLKKQAEDIDLIIERMNAQIKNLTKAYREELTKIDQAFESERLEMLERHRNDWNSLNYKRSDNEVDYLKESEERVEEFANQLEHLRVQDAEEYNMVKIKLETDVQVLEQQLQAMRATYQLNSEKLDYNFTVLKKREEENTITKSRQKRKITRLQDTLNNLKTKLAKQEKQFRDDNQALGDDYKRITDQFKELQKKSKHFQATDTRKFIDIWIMNEDEAMNYARKILNEDMVIHTQQLGLPWNPPQSAKILEGEDRPSLSGEAPKLQASSTSVVKPAKSAADEIIRAASSSDLPQFFRSTLHAEKTAVYHPVLIKNVLELLCNEADFLVEKKLVHLLAPLEHDERLLMKLDSIFKAIGVETEEDIHKLTEYFVIPDEEDPSLLSLIHPNQVLKAIRLFVCDNFSPSKPSLQKQVEDFNLTVKERDSYNDTKYWAELTNVLPTERERKWDALHVGLEKYHTVLTQRSKLIEETEKLQNQNSELRMLLQQYVGSRVNQDLQIPPTHTIPNEVLSEYARE